MTIIERNMQDYQTQGGLTIIRQEFPIEYHQAIEPLIDKLNEQLGLLFTSGFEYPGRYTRWDIGFVNPPLAISCQNKKFTLTALNSRGKILLPFLKDAITSSEAVASFEASETELSGFIKENQRHFPEELRSKQFSIFTLLRQILALFKSDQDNHLGLYGSFGYDLAFQFEPIRKHLTRDPSQRDLVLYLPDEIYLVDHQSKSAKILRYDFLIKDQSTQSLPREGIRALYKVEKSTVQSGDHKPGEYADIVHAAKAYFKRGDLFEVVPGQTFYETSYDQPSEIFRRLRKANPAPYASFINLGEKEYLVGASPEMFVRVTGKRVETCPISGTIARGKDALSDAEQILTLLKSEKDASELTMCTDVDRNDKSRICVPGSVQVIGRRQIEMYSRVIHTVDHVEGILRDQYDGIDAFLSHMWVVTVTGAPKIWAMQFIEDHEKSQRRWYGGAIGFLQFNGDINTGLVLRTIRIHQGIAELRVGATLLFDSDPQAEEQETLLKASAFLDAIRGTPKTAQIASDFLKKQPGKNKKILLVDHQDSFVHTLANYFRQTGAEVITLRSGFAESTFKEINPDLVVLSPGPGCPKDFNCHETIALTLKQQKPIFGVCLGLQALIEYFGGNLKTLDYPVHGKQGNIQVLGGKIFANLPKNLLAGRYHSLYADRDSFPAELTITAETSDGVVMAIEHKTLPIAAVQFHPESIMSLQGNNGLHMIFNVVEELMSS